MKLDTRNKVREIAGEHIILLQGRAGGELSKVVALNSTALFLWENLSGKDFSINDISDLLIDQFEVDKDTATNDAKQWLDTLLTNGLIIE